MNYRDDYLKLILECGKYIEEGITIDGVKMPFTLIDYYNLVGRDLLDRVNHREIRTIAHKYRLSYGVSNRYLNRFIDFLDRENVSFETVNNPMEILKQKYAFIFNDQRYIPTYEDVNMIMNIFDLYGVLKHDRLIYQALHRVARGFPIFPLLLSEDEKKLGR